MSEQQLAKPVQSNSMSSDSVYLGTGLALASFNFTRGSQAHRTWLQPHGSLTSSTNESFRQS